MVIKDIFLLERSDKFKISNRDEASVNLSLKRATAVPNTKILGKVLDNFNEVIEGATVKILTLKYKPIEHTITDSCGRFLFNNIISPGIYYLIATAPSYTISKSYKIIVRDTSINRLIVRLNCEEKLNSGIAYGYVQDGICNRLKNSIIKVFSCNNPDTLAAISHTNDNGEYLIYGLAPGRYSIIVEKNGYDFPSKVSFIIEDNEFTNLNLILYAHDPSYNGTITGQISYNNRPVPYAFVALYSMTDHNSTLIKVKKCNEDGVYLFENVKPGKYVVRSNKVEQIFECGVTD